MTPLVITAVVGLSALGTVGAPRAMAQGRAAGERSPSTPASVAAAAPAPTAADKKPASQYQGPPPPEDYRMSAGDKLRIEVYKDPQLSQSLQIRPDGKITLPLVGDIEATGRTPIELRDAIRDALKEYVNNPTVTVIVVEAVAATAYIMGEVNHPGSISLQGPLTVLQALAMAGGLKDFANAKNIRILRKSRLGTQLINFNYKEASQSLGPQMYLQPGDTVVVPD
jgi:polysaccharide export outer membrane protein